MRLTIKAATLANFGRVNGGRVNTLDVNNSVGTSVLYRRISTTRTASGPL